MKKGRGIPSKEEMYRAFYERDGGYEGIFVTGVRTTGIFCRTTCAARKPKRENIEFFAGAGEAMAAGYRPCLRCRPLDVAGGLPDWLRPLWTAVEEAPARRWTEEDLKGLGLEPTRVRRWFKARYGMSFLAWSRARRLGQVFQGLAAGGNFAAAAEEADFDSLSGFCEAMRRAVGGGLRGARERQVLKVMEVPSPLGPIVLAGDEKAVWLVEFRDKNRLEKQFAELAKRFNRIFFPGETPVLKQLATELERYFAGEEGGFRTPVMCPGSELQEAVWGELKALQRGETVTYGELACRVGRAHGARAVARAVGANRLAIVLPCHRVLGANGRLTGYAGGLWRKRFLLMLEGGDEPGLP